MSTRVHPKPTSCRPVLCLMVPFSFCLSTCLSLWTIYYLSVCSFFLYFVLCCSCLMWIWFSIAYAISKQCKTICMFKHNHLQAHQLSAFNFSHVLLSKLTILQISLRHCILRWFTIPPVKLSFRGTTVLQILHFASFSFLSYHIQIGLETKSLFSLKSMIDCSNSMIV